MNLSSSSVKWEQSEEIMIQYLQSSEHSVAYKRQVKYQIPSENMLKGSKLQQPETDRKHWCVVVPPLLENTTKETGRGPNLGTLSSGTSCWPWPTDGSNGCSSPGKAPRGRSFRMQCEKGELSPDAGAEFYSFWEVTAISSRGSLWSRSW